MSPLGLVKAEAVQLPVVSIAISAATSEAMTGVSFRYKARYKKWEDVLLRLSPEVGITI